MTNVTFSDRPELRVSDVSWISASSQSIFAQDEAYAYGLEAAAKYRNFWLNGEVNFFGMDQRRDPAGGGADGPDVDFLGYYVQGGWIITGETKRYSMSKAALNALTLMLADELRHERVKVNAVCPGWVATDMGGRGGRPVEDGAKGIIWAAMLPDDGPTGGFFRDRQRIDW